MAQALRVENLTKTFEGGDIVAVDDVSFEVGPTEFFSLLGPSGCGKTTTLRCIAGLEKPDKGRIYVAGKDVTETESHKRPVNLVFQNLALFPHMTVYENVAFGLKREDFPEKEIEKKVKEVLETVELSGYEDRNSQDLSGGEKQRVALARGLAKDPALILLDEPLGPLDRKLRDRMMFELQEIQRRVGTAFVYVTHDQEEAMTMSNEIALERAGKIIQQGSPTELYECPKNRFVADFIGRSNLLDGTYKDSTVEVPGMGEVKVGEKEFDEDSPVAIVIKPERTGIGTDLNGFDTILNGKVTESFYTGANIRYTISFGEKEISVQDVWEGEEIFQEGDQVSIGLKAKDISVIESE